MEIITKYQLIRALIEGIRPCETLKLNGKDFTIISSVEAESGTHNRNSFIVRGYTNAGKDWVHVTTID